MFEFYLDDKRKVERVIKSCKTIAQTDVALDMIDNLHRKWNIIGDPYFYLKLDSRILEILFNTKPEEVQLSFPFYWRLKV